MNKESTDEKAILQSHFENKILKSARYKTKYQNKTGNYDEKEQKYFIASFYRDANITEDDDFKQSKLKIPKSEEEDKMPLTFATCFSKNNNGNFIEQPFDTTHTHFDEDDTYPAYGIIYKDFHTAVWSKRDNKGESIINFFHNLKNYKHSKEIIDFLTKNKLPTNIPELRKKGIKRKQIQKLIKFLKDNNHKYVLIDEYYGESVYPGENAIQQYLSKLDYLRYRIGADLEHNDKKLKEANSRAKTQFKRASNEPRYEFLMYDKKNKNIAYIGYTDNQQYSGGKVEDNKIYYDGGPYRSTITYDRAKKEMIYNLACNEFISQQNEKVASFVVLMKNFTDNNFKKDTLHEFFRLCSCYEGGEANIPKLYKMIFAQRDLGIPYMPILGGDGNVRCVKLSKLLSMMKDDDFYKKYIKSNSPEKIQNDIQTKQTELNKIKAGPPLKDDDEYIKKINKKPKELQLTLIAEITDKTIEDMQKFEKEKISELEKQANKQNDVETKEQQPENIIEEKASISQLNEENIQKNNAGQNNSFHNTSQQWWQKFYICSCCDDTNNNESSTQINTNKKNINLN